MGRRVVTFDDFSGGDWGTRNAWKAPKNSFQATNMRLYRTGELGVRAGIKDVTPTSNENPGVVRGLTTFKNGTSGVISIHGSAVRRFTLGGTVFTNTGGIAVDGAVNGFSEPSANDVYFYVSSDKLYKWDGSTLTAYAGAPANGIFVCQYGDRTVLSVASTNTIRWSAANDPTSWPAANSLAVGSGSEIGGLYAQRNHLLISKPEGFYAITGTLGVNHTLRKLCSETAFGRNVSPYDSGRLSPNDILWYTPQAGNGGIAAFNGSSTKYLRLVRDIPFTYTPTILAGKHPSHMAFVDVGSALNTAKAWLFSEGAWTYHSIPITWAAGFTGYTNTRVGVPYVTETGVEDTIVFTDGGAAAAQPNYYAWVASLDRPGFESGGLTIERAGDLSSSAVSGTVTFPEWHAEDGTEFTVRSVIVDFRTWATGASTTNHFDLTVNALRIYEGTSPVASTTVSFDQAAASSSASGTIQRREFNFGEQGRAGGFQLAFTNVRGLAIQRIHVVVDTFPPRW